MRTSNHPLDKCHDWHTNAAPVVEMGHGPETIVFLHGLFGSPQHWQSIMVELADHYRVIAPQLPVDKQPNRRSNGIHTIDDLTDHIERIIENSGLQQFVICGNSLGGLIAIDYCLRHPGRAKGLVLAGSAGLHERGITNGSKPRPTRAFVRTVVSDILYNKELMTEQLIDEWYHTIQDRDYVRFVLRVSRATRNRNVEAELGKLKLPTLIVWGRNDEITRPDVAEAFRDRIEGAQLEFIDDCGHAPNWEQPEIFANILREFLPSCFPEDVCEPSRWLPTCPK